MSTIKLYRYGAKRGVFCSRMCREGFKADREHGLIYGPYRYADGTFAMDAEEASERLRFCPYCGTREGDPRKGRILSDAQQEQAALESEYLRNLGV